MGGTARAGENELGLPACPAPQQLGPPRLINPVLDKRDAHLFISGAPLMKKRPLSRKPFKSTRKCGARAA